MPLSNTRIGELCIVAEALLWSLFPVVTILTFSQLGPLFSAAWGTILSCAFFALVIRVQGRWREMFLGEAWGDTLLSPFFIGILYYVFLYTGIRHTTADNASIMALMEVFFSFVILTFVWKKETADARRIIGAILMAGGALLILLPKASGWHSGDLLILIAAAFAPIGNIFAKRANTNVTAAFIMFARSSISSVVLLALALALEPIPSAHTLASSLTALVINGFLLLGLSKILWLEGIARIPITKAISLASITPLFTFLFAFLLLHERATAWQIAGFVPIAAGVYLLTRGKAVSD